MAKNSGSSEMSSLIHIDLLLYTMKTLIIGDFLVSRIILFWLQSWVDHPRRPKLQFCLSSSAAHAHNAISLLRMCNYFSDIKRCKDRCKKQSLAVERSTVHVGIVILIHYYYTHFYICNNG